MLSGQCLVFLGQSDSPVNEIKIIKAVAFVNPLEESDKQFEEFITNRRAER